MYRCSFWSGVGSYIKMSPGITEYTRLTMQGEFQNLTSEYPAFLENQQIICIYLPLTHLASLNKYLQSLTYKKSHLFSTCSNVPGRIKTINTIHNINQFHFNLSKKSAYKFQLLPKYQTRLLLLFYQGILCCRSIIVHRYNHLMDSFPNIAIENFEMTM